MRASSACSMNGAILGGSVSEASLFPSSVSLTRVAAGLSYLTLLFFFAFLQRLQLELRGTETRTWWASNGRDAVNAVGVALLAWGLRSVGYGLPIALLLAGSIVVLSTAIVPTLGRWRSRPGRVIAVSVLLGLPPVFAPAAWERTLVHLFEVLF